MEDEEQRAQGASLAMFYHLVLSLLLMCRNHDNPTLYFRFAFISIPLGFTFFATPEVGLGWAAAAAVLRGGSGWARRYGGYVVRALFAKWFVDTGHPIYLAWATAS